MILIPRLYSPGGTVTVEPHGLTIEEMQARIDRAADALPPPVVLRLLRADGGAVSREVLR